MLPLVVLPLSASLNRGPAFRNLSVSTSQNLTPNKPNYPFKVKKKWKKDTAGNRERKTRTERNLAPSVFLSKRKGRRGKARAVESWGERGNLPKQLRRALITILNKI